MPCIPPYYRSNGVDHGPQIILAPIDKKYCSMSTGKRYIEVFAAFASEDWKTVHSFIESLCKLYPETENDPKAVCSQAAADLSFAGLPSEAATINRSN